MPAAETSVPRLALTTAEAAAAIGVHPKTLRNWRSQGRGPTPTRLGKNQTLYRVSDIDAWLSAVQAAGSVAAAGGAK